MLLALLYDEQDQIIASALARDQQPYGPRYWSEIFPTPLHVRPGFQVAYVDVEDQILRGKALSISIELDPSPELTAELEGKLQVKRATQRNAY